MKKSFQIIISSILVINLCGICVFCSPGKNHGGPRDKETKKGFIFRHGEKLYTGYCAPCHGVEGEGDGIYFGFGLEPKPANFTDPDFFQNRSEMDLIILVEKGSKYLGKSNLCPPWGGTLHDEEILSIVKFLQLKFEKEDTLDFRSD